MGSKGGVVVGSIRFGGIRFFCGGSGSRLWIGICVFRRVDGSRGGGIEARKSWQFGRVAVMCGRRKCHHPGLRPARRALRNFRVRRSPHPNHPHLNLPPSRGKRLKSSLGGVMQRSPSRGKGEEGKFQCRDPSSRGLLRVTCGWRGKMGDGAAVGMACG